MNPIIKKLGLFLGCLFLMQCDEKDAQCDASKHKNISYMVTAPVNASAGGLVFETYLAGNIRYYKWYRSTDFVCIYDLVSVTSVIKSFDIFSVTDFNARAYVQYNLPIVTEVIDLVADGHLLLGTANINLLPSFVVGSGSFDSVIEVFFPTTGNNDQDLIYLLGKVSQVQMILKYSSN